MASDQLLAWPPTKAAFDIMINEVPEKAISQATNTNQLETYTSDRGTLIVTLSLRRSHASPPCDGSVVWAMQMALHHIPQPCRKRDLCGRSCAPAWSSLT